MPRKGQSLSEEAIQKMKQSKIKRLLSKYDWKNVEGFFDVELKISCGKGDKKKITIREFKRRLESGQSLRSMKNEGIYKHLIYFFSQLAQGKYKLSKNEFVDLYNSGLSLEEIGQQYEISKAEMGFLRQLYDIKKKGATFIQRKNSEDSLTQRQIEILYGSMMGDACWRDKRWASAAKFKHGYKQKDYLLWKYYEFENVACENSLKMITSIDHRFDKEIKTWMFYTHANTDIELCLKLFYNKEHPDYLEDNPKHLNQKILDKLTPLSIAVWFMDDGQCDFKRRHELHKRQRRIECYRFCTDSFSRSDCELIKKWFKKKYNVQTRITTRNNKLRIEVKARDNEKFKDIIRLNMLPMFDYKIKYDSHIAKREKDSEQILLGELKKVPLGACFSSLLLEKQDEYTDRIVTYMQHKGIESLVKKPGGWQKHLKDIFSYDATNLIKNNFISFSNKGNKFLMSHFPSYWSARSKGNMSPKEVFNNRSYLGDILRKIIIRGDFPDEHKILGALQRYRGNKVVSGFMPAVAKAIYTKYCNNANVLDFCAGYGGRMMGALSCDGVETYTGIEVNFDTYLGLHDLYKTLKKFGTLKTANLLNQDAIIGMKQFADKAFDFCMTSPPYFDAEQYSDDQTQSYKQYETYGDWFNGFLIASVMESMRISHKTAIIISNTGGYMIANDFERWLNSSSIDFEKDSIKTPVYSGKFRFEPIFVF